MALALALAFPFLVVALAFALRCDWPAGLWLSESVSCSTFASKLIASQESETADNRAAMEVFATSGDDYSKACWKPLRGPLNASKGIATSFV